MASTPPIRNFLSRHADGLLAVRRLPDDLEPAFREQLAKAPPKQLMIVDERHPEGG